MLMNIKEQLAGYCPPGVTSMTCLEPFTHKREIITLYQQGCLTPTIAKKTNHSKDSVDRYIKDYENVKLVKKVTADIHSIAQLTRLSKRVIKQYLDLIPDDELEAMTPEPELVQTPGRESLNDQ